jgi:hypothetical protein
MTREEPMEENTPLDEPYRRPTWEEVLRTQEEWREARRRHEAEWARLSAERKAVIEMIKRQEELAAQRRCWLF